jgi:glycogen debranching enzyme
VSSSCEPPETPAGSVDEAPASQYRIAASATLQERRTRTLKHGDTFAVFDHRGDIGGEPGNSEGLYNRDTRMLSQFHLLLEEARPLLLSSTTQDDNAVFSADLSNPDLLVDGKIALRREKIHVHRMRFIWNGACYERLLVRNFSDNALHVRLTVSASRPISPILFEVRGEHARRAASRATRAQERASVALSYVGLDAVERITHRGVRSRAQDLDHRARAYELALKPRECGAFSSAAGTPRRRPAWTGRVLSADARGAACAARIERARRERRQFEFGVQRDRAARSPICTC